MSTYIYLASPYNDPDEHVRLQRYAYTLDATHYLLKRKLWCYSPIVHCHDLATQYDLPKDYEYWQGYNRAMLRGADSLLVLMLDGWETSRGVRGEVFDALERQMPVRGLRIASDGYSIVLGSFLPEDIESAYPNKQAASEPAE